MSKIKVKLGLQAYFMLRFIHKNDGSVGVCLSDVSTYTEKFKVHIPRCLTLLKRLESREYIEKQYYGTSRKPSDTFYLTTSEGDIWLKSGAIIACAKWLLKLIAIIAGIVAAWIAYKTFYK